MQQTTSEERHGTTAAALAQVSLWSLFFTFLRIGSTAFGGFTALISVIENIIVRKRRLMHAEDMLDGISLAMMLPGPVAVNVVAYTGYRLRGGPGALVSAAGVIMPSFILLVGLSWFYLRFGEVPAVGSFFSGFVPAVTAIIINTAWGMSGKAIKTLPEFIIGAMAAAALIVIGGFYSTVAVVICAGIIGMLLYYRPRVSSVAGGPTPEPTLNQPSKKSFPFGVLAVSMLLLACLLVAFSAPLSWIAHDSYSRIFVTFSGMSLMLFGGGFVFIPMIQKVVVDGIHWVTQSEFTSAIAMGQVTPGPILISAAFIGYKVKGLLGAALATASIFSPPALLMVNCSMVLDRIKSSIVLQAALRGIRPAVVGMIFSAALVVGRGAVFHWGTPLIFMLSLFAIMRLRLDVVWIIPAAGAAGFLIY